MLVSLVTSGKQPSDLASYGRLMPRTTTAGQFRDRLTDARPDTGFDLLGRIRG